MRRLLIPFLLAVVCQSALGQKIEGPVMDHAFPREYEIGGITVSGAETTDANAVKMFSGLQVGEKITVPGERITQSLRNIWEQKLFSDVRIEAAEVRGSTIFLHIIVTERPRLSRYRFDGVSKSESEKLRERIDLVRGRQVNESLLSNTRNAIVKHYVDKGHLKASVTIDELLDTAASSFAMRNGVMLRINVDKGPRTRIKDVFFNGNEALSDAALRKAMRKTKRKRWYNIFGTSKFVHSEFRADKGRIIDRYNDEGYRNAAVVRDTMYFVSDKKVTIELDVDEGQRFYFRNISFIGNAKYTDSRLDSILSIKRGDAYSKRTLESRMYMNQSGRDITSLYMDDGYLSFYPELIELVDGDSIDLDIRIREGKQYRIRNVIISGNSKTNDHVVRREIRTKPGELFSRSDVIRTQRELANLGYFNPETLGVNPIQDARTGTVDLEYSVEERPSDRLELSGGYGAGRVVMSVGLSFTNFSMRNILKGSAWTPLPAGDGQTLNVRAQTNGRFFQSYSLSFVEPWLGGRKPNALSMSVYHTVQTNGVPRFVQTESGRVENPIRQSLLISGASVGLGRRMNWPDDYFLLRQTLSYQVYDLRNWQALFSFNNGRSHVVAYQVQVSRNSVDQPFFARSGSDISLSLKATPPYSLVDERISGVQKDWENMPPSERYRLAEFYKWKLTTQWFNRITRSKSGHDLVLHARAGFGFLGRYNARIGDSPFERFFLGGSALTGFQLDGREIVGLRGYDDLSLSENTGSFIIAKYTTELRFPISLNPSATIFALGFFEAGRTWNSLDRFDPFQLYQSTGLGLRLFLPMFGPMGLDYGWRLNDVPGQPNMARGQFHFTIGIDLGEL